VKDKAKRDKNTIAALMYSNSDLLDKVNAKHKMCQQLIALSVRLGADQYDIYDIIQNDHFLRKCI